MEQQRIKIASGGLQCDSPTCDWTDPTVKVEDYKKWLNAPCPKCGENVLTEEDLTNTLTLHNLVKLFNAIPEENFEEFMEQLQKDIPKSTQDEILKKYDLPEGTERVNMTFDVHKKVHIKDVKPADDGKE
jgi:uncharacterized HAD superfamily protein